MDGKDLRRRLRHLLNTVEGDPFLDTRSSYDFLYAAACRWVIETECLTAEQSITTAKNQAGYALSGDFLALYLEQDDDFFLKYYDASDYTFIPFRPYEDVIVDNNTTSATPASFTISDDQTLDDLISDTADNDGGSAVGSKATLTMDTEVFADVTPGDIIHNTTDGSDGVVVKVASTKILEVCLFGGTDNEIDTSDAFIIQPKKRMKLILDPPPDTDGHTVTVYYLQKPAPVYSDYDVYSISYDYADAFAKYAAWLYKYRDQVPDFGDAFYQHWRMQIDNAKQMASKGFAKEQPRLMVKLR